MSLAKRLGVRRATWRPRWSSTSTLDDVCEPVEVSGPGFLNLRLRDAWCPTRRRARRRPAARRPARRSARSSPIDYSAPNVAKEMHVGHLRTTVVGDALARTLEHLGHEVIRQNHIGDWGTPFGMLIEHLLDVGEDSAEAQQLVGPTPTPSTSRAGEVRRRPGLRRPRPHAGGQRSRPATPTPCASGTSWSTLSKQYFNRVYATLGVTLTDDDLAGESLYNDELADICDELEAAGSPR